MTRDLTIMLPAASLYFAWNVVIAASWKLSAIGRHLESLALAITNAHAQLTSSFTFAVNELQSISRNSLKDIAKLQHGIM